MHVIPPVENQKSKIENELIPLCQLEELPIGLGRAFKVDGLSIAVFRTRQGRLLAVDNRCPHKNGPLADGMLAGDQSVCPLHAFRFDGHTGECDQPGQCPVRTHEIAEHNGLVSLRISKGGTDAPVG